MTIGEKVKYLRNRVGITQSKLAEFSDIHPVSIRKYETNKMVPQQAQLERISKALGASSLALTEVSEQLKIETIDDFISLVINLIKSEIIVMNGERAENGIYIPDTVTFSIKENIAKLFTTNVSVTEIKLSELSFNLKDNFALKDIVTWESVYNRYMTKCKELEGVTDPEPLGYLKEYKDILEQLELEMTCSHITRDGRYFE